MISIMKHVYTSSGVVKNPGIARVGVVGLSSLSDHIYDLIDHGIDLSYAEYIDELQSKLDEGLIGENEFEEYLDSYESDSSTILIGDWTKAEDGTYSPNKSGPNGWAASYSSGTGNLCVEWSTVTKWVTNTSPCYVMADGSGPCGDLDRPGTTLLAYSLPVELFRTEN